MPEAPDPEELPVGAAPEDEAGPTPLPAPSDGESPPPDEARGLPVAADEDCGAEPDADPEAGGEDEEGPGLELDEATAEQDRSYSGVVLKVLPTMPKLGLGVVGAPS